MVFRAALVKGRHSRHAEANNLIKKALRTAGYLSVLEPLGLLRNDGKRPDGVTSIPWQRGLPLTWDYTCADYFAPSRITNNRNDAANERERHKV